MCGNHAPPLPAQVQTETNPPEKQCFFKTTSAPSIPEVMGGVIGFRRLINSCPYACSPETRQEGKVLTHIKALGRLLKGNCKGLRARARAAKTLHTPLGIQDGGKGKRFSFWGIAGSTKSPLHQGS